MASLRRLTSLFLTGFSIATIGLARAEDPGSKGSAGSKPAQAKAKVKARPVNFARDVRPILSDNCFACHGPDDKAAQGRPAARHQGRGVRQARERRPGDRARQARRERADRPDRERRPRAADAARRRAASS